MIIVFRTYTEQAYTKRGEEKKEREGVRMERKTVPDNGEGRGSA
jgi:hypothetical protein